MPHRIAFSLIVLAFTTVPAMAQLPHGPNVVNEWYQDEVRDVRVLYGYSSPEPDDIHCRIDFHYDGRISLLVVRGFDRDETTPVSQIQSWYTLVPTTSPLGRGVELRVTSGKAMKGKGLDAEIKPSIAEEDLFTRYCVPLLPDLFWQIPEEDITLFRSQYGELFELD